MRGRGVESRAALVALGEAQVVLCSACLVGARCRWDGDTRSSQAVVRALAGKAVVPLCPEVAGGLTTPRPPALLGAGLGPAVLDGRARVRTADGRDVTAPFVDGAELAFAAARRYGATVAILKEGSPSCGVHRVHVGERRFEGQGVTAARLARSRVVLLSEEDLEGRDRDAGDSGGEVRR